MNVKLSLAALLLAVASLWIACGGSEESVCGGASDCSADQICEDGVCKTPSRTRCTGDPDCPGGQTCSDGVCRPLSDPDMGNNGANNTNNTVNNSVDMGTDTNQPNDNINPEIVSVTPADGTENVAIAATVQVVFSEDMDITTVNFQSLLLKNPAGQDVSSVVVYDSATKTATITPNAPLNLASGYRVVPTAFLKDPAGNALRVEPTPETRFYTATDEPADHRALVEQFAPVIYQSIENANGQNVNYDMPTIVDFDGNLKARDNRANAQQTATRTKAAVYYSVVESYTHYFITYALYYPLRRDKNGDAEFEHDWTGAVFVVDKATKSFKLAEGLRIGAGDDTIFAYQPSSSDVDDTGFVTSKTFGDGQFEGDRYPMFIPSGEHAACQWYVEGNAAPVGCFHNSQEFSEGPTAGVIMRPGVAQTYAEAALGTGGIMEMTYELVPLTGLWARRTAVDRELLWEQVSAYSPIDDRPKVYEGSMEPIVFPNRLVSDDTTTYGKAPFAWLKLPANSNQGQWLFDPAYILTVRYNFGDTTVYRTDYCHNVFLGINRRADTTITECVVQ